MNDVKGGVKIEKTGRLDKLCRPSNNEIKVDVKWGLLHGTVAYRVVREK